MHVTTYRSEDRNGFLAEPDGVEDVVMENGLEQIVFVIGLERRLSGHHLVHQDPERPPVHRGAVLQLLQDLSQEEHVNTPETRLLLTTRLLTSRLLEANEAWFGGEQELTSGAM